MILIPTLRTASVESAFWSDVEVWEGIVLTSLERSPFNVEMEGKDQLKDYIFKVKNEDTR